MFKIKIGKGTLMFTFKPSWRYKDFKIGIAYRF